MTRDRRWLILLLTAVSSLVVTNVGQAQVVAQQATAPQKIVAQGPIRLESTGPFYTLKLVEIADTRPTEYVWLLQKGNQETAYKSLSAVSLRRLVSQLPKGTTIYCTTQSLSEPAHTAIIGVSSYPSFDDFVAFCRSKGVQFAFGTSF